MTRSRTNFGGNVRFVPAAVCVPRNEDQVLDCLRQHAGERLRCIGSAHSWSRILATDGVLLDLRHLKDIKLDPKGVRVGAGCTLRNLLRFLRRRDLTLPTLGATTRQRVVGAIATGTHGSGAPSLSHFVEEARLAAFDPDSGAPTRVTLDSGPGLRAARCALGCLGVMLEVVMRVEPAYRIEERVEMTGSLDPVLAGQAEWPLQQFALLPWSWTYVVYRRRRTPASGGRLQALFWRVWNFVFNDVLLHLALKIVLLGARLLGERVIRGFFMQLPRLVREASRIDASEAVLTMHHHLFRHVEMELFVPESKLRDALAAIREIVRIAGEGATPTADLERRLGPELTQEVWKLRGSYTLHYPLFVRRVLQDDTLVSMASAGAQPEPAWYSISLFTYRAVEEDFARFAQTVARCVIELTGARLHWGKYFPLPLEAAAAAYPEFAAFEQICRDHDPQRRFWY